MPEATKAVIEREGILGIPEAMRAYSAQYTKRAMLSRAAAGNPQINSHHQFAGAVLKRSGMLGIYHF